MGFDTFADYALDDRMAENLDNVYRLLNDLYDKLIEYSKDHWVDHCCINCND